MWVFVVNDTATTESYTDGHTLSLHDALPISAGWRDRRRLCAHPPARLARAALAEPQAVTQRRTRPAPLRRPVERKCHPICGERRRALYDQQVGHARCHASQRALQPGTRLARQPDAGVAADPLHAERRNGDRSEERRVGKECGRTWRSRGSPYHY